MAPVALAAVWFGGPFLDALILAAGVLMIVEWCRLCADANIGWRSGAAMFGVPLAILLASFGRWPFGYLLLVAAAVLVLVLGVARGNRSPLLMPAGILWVGVPCVALLWIAADPAHGRAKVLWLLFVVWATDVGAYAVGRTVGGPRLAPRMSPNKTWSGLLGGMACAGLFGFAGSWLGGMASPLYALAGGAVLAVIAQFGDLAESVVKRRFGVKDAGTLIPGHGGLLDRLDGLLAVAPLMALLDWIGGNAIWSWR